jgi:hypothetical protein
MDNIKMDLGEAIWQLPYEKGSELAAPCIFQIYTRDRN